MLTVIKVLARGAVCLIVLAMTGAALAQTPPPPPSGTPPPPPPPPTLPTVKEQCFNNGWQTFRVFKNQGDCVSYVATQGKNPPSK